MEKLYELAELAKQMCGESWEYSRITSYSRGYITGKDGRTIVQTRSGLVPANACQFMEMADPAAILAIAEAFRALEQRAESAESKLVPVGWKLVPIEPTPEMMVAGTLVSEFQEDPSGMYRAMIEAAPEVGK